ncbi:aldo/keto reductase [Pedobacter sp. L105]|uniref:aldo/keto reductase n=1 Tax=Pedobacter sp. L105 TaxID=1641871 RepID=UPI00131E711C|nr:aldo/keto reductase [Pedobacter sp. L105]
MKNGKIRRDFSIGGKLTVNRLGYGTKQITQKGLSEEPLLRKEALKVLKHAVKSGVNFIATADSHGQHVAEELITEALYPYQMNLVFGIKGGIVRSDLEESLHRLKVGSVDLYQLDRVNPEDAEATFELLKNAQIDKKIKHIGLSEVTIDQIKQAQRHFDVAFVQNEYSIDNRKWEDVLEFTKQHNIAFIPSPALNEDHVKGKATLQKIADKHQVRPEQIALSWLLQHSDNILLIPGTSHLEHLEENLNIESIELSEEDLYELDSIHTLSDISV